VAPSEKYVPLSLELPPGVRQNVIGGDAGGSVRSAAHMGGLCARVCVCTCKCMCVYVREGVHT